VKEAEAAELEVVEQELDREREDAELDIDDKVQAEKEKRREKLQTELQEFNKRSAGAKGELEFSERLSAYKGKVASLDA